MSSKLESGAADSSEARHEAEIDPLAWAAGWGRGRKRTYLIAVQLAGEAFLAAASVVVAYVMLESWPASLGEVRRTWFNLPRLLLAVVYTPEFAPYRPLFVMAPFIQFLILQWMRLYHRRMGETRPFGAAWSIAKGTSLGTAALVLLANAYGISRGADGNVHPLLFFVYQWMLVFFGVLLFHSATLIGVLALHAFDMGRSRVAVVHGEAMAETMLEALESPTSEYRLVGVVTLATASEAVPPTGVKWLGALADLPRLINKYDLDELILAVDPGDLSSAQRLEVAQTCWRMGVGLKMVTPFQPFFRTNAHPETLGGVSLLHVENLGLYATVPQILKRSMDIVVSLLALLALAPLMLAVALIIKLDSRGPIFFVQQRVGLNNRTFRMIKFRSMRADADAAIHQQYLKQLIRGDEAHSVDKDGKAIFKIVRDPRITRIGAFIRRTSIDELPQLINVLRGEMSLVGPRPPIQYEVDEYQDWHLKRLHIRPGITGLWQVSGRNRLSFDQMVQLDIDYIERWSLWLDIKILFKTVPVLLHIGQAY